MASSSTPRALAAAAVLVVAVGIGLTARAPAPVTTEPEQDSQTWTPESGDVHFALRLCDDAQDPPSTCDSLRQRARTHAPIGAADVDSVFDVLD